MNGLLAVLTPGAIGYLALLLVAYALAARYKLL